MTEPREQAVQISFFNPTQPSVKAETKAAKIVVALWALIAYGIPVLIWLTGDEKGNGPLVQANFLGFPLHYWLVAQFITVSFILLCALFVKLWNDNVKE